MGNTDMLTKKIQEDVLKYKDNREIVPADLVEILTVRHLSPDCMHANPDDEFCDPKIGANESIVEKYVNEAEATLKDGGECFEEPIMVAKLSDGEYMIVNGHHRWAAAIKMGLAQVRVVIANPGTEDLVGFL